jgi:hypothetical protein
MKTRPSGSVTMGPPPVGVPHQIAWELAELVGIEEKIGLLGKHARRLDWLIAHREAVLADLALPEADWTIKGAFVVDDDLGPYIRETPVPVLTLARLMAELEISPQSAAALSRP